MKTLMRISSAAFLVAALAGPATAGPEEFEVVGKAKMTKPKLRMVTQAAGGPREPAMLPVTIDLSSVSVDNQPVVLGAYVAQIRFDPKKVQIVSVERGTDGDFSRTPPITTSREKANEEGLLSITGVQTGMSAASILNVANVRAIEIVPGGASTISIRLDSAATALHRHDRVEAVVRIPVEE